MKKQTLLFGLIPLIVVLTAVTAGAGLFWQHSGRAIDFTTLHGTQVQLYGKGLYRHDTLFNAPVFRGTDFVTLFLGLPLLIGAFWRARRRSVAAQLLLLGVLSFFVYYSFSLTFSAAFNPLFLVYVALFAVTLLALTYAAVEVDLTALSNQIASGLRMRGTAVFMFVAGAGTCFVWLSEIVGPMSQGALPVERLGPYTTLVTHAFDIAVIAPAAILTGVYLLRRAPIGYVLAPILLTLCLLVGIVVIAQTVFQYQAGILLPVGVYVGMVGSWIFLGVWAFILLFRLLHSLERGVETAVARSPRTA